MAAYFLARNPATLFIATIAVLLQAESALSGFPTTFTLERAFPTNHLVESNELRLRDGLRHPRILKHSSSSSSSVPSVVTFPVHGAYDPFRVGFYYTRLRLGSPPKQYYVAIDTGSDLLWVGCTSCKGCPRSSTLKIPLQFYNPSTSSAASLISCSDQRCLLGTQSSNSGCSNSDHQCSYTYPYTDGSGTSGYLVSDLIHLDTLVADSKPSNASASIVFGCSTSVTGNLTKSLNAVDGILGFGQQGISLIAQLSSQGIAPNAFSHCLVGDGVGGGVLVLGQIMEPNMVYTPLITSKQYYNLNLLSISVNGHKLPIDPSVFATSSSSEGTIIDSGTTLAYLPGEAYDPFLDAIIDSVSLSVNSVFLGGAQCFSQVTSRTLETFPNVSLNFAGGASMLVRPQDYLLQHNSEDGLWCFGFKKTQGITILGDLVLKDKIVVYDLGGRRIGWANYNCTMPLNVSTMSSRGRSENGGISSLQDECKIKKMILMVVVLQLLVFAGFA